MVPKGKRKPSPTDFLAYARDIRILTLKKYKSVIPKTHRFTIGVPLCDSSGRIYEYAKKANSIFPKKRLEAELRRKYFMEAYAETQWFISELEVAQEVIQFDENHLKDWIELVDVELNRIKSIMESDEKRFGHLLEEKEKNEVYWLEYIAKVLGGIWKLLSSKKETEK